MTADEIQGLPFLVNVETAARAFDISLNTAYGLIDKGDFPVPVIRVGSQFKIKASEIQRVLDVQPADAPVARQDSHRATAS